MEKEYKVLKKERKLIQTCIENIHNQVQSLAEEIVGYFASRYERLSSLQIRFNDVQLKIIEYNARNKRDDQKFEVEEYQKLIDNLIFSIQDIYNRVMSSCTTNNVNDKLKPLISVNVPVDGFANLSYLMAHFLTLVMCWFEFDDNEWHFLFLTYIHKQRYVLICKCNCYTTTNDNDAIYHTCEMSCVRTQIFMINESTTKYSFDKLGIQQKLF